MHKDLIKEEILSFVNENRESYASRAVCNRILGRVEDINNEIIEKLKANIGSVNDEDLQSCYDLIK